MALIQEVPERRIWDAAPAKVLTVEVTNSFPGRDSLEMRWFLSCNEPKSRQPDTLVVTVPLPTIELLPAMNSLP